MMASAECNAIRDVLRKEMPPISLYDEDLLIGCPNHLMPLMVWSAMENFEVHWILIDQGASCDIIFSNLFRTLNLSEDDLMVYGVRKVRLNLVQGVHRRPLGFSTLRVTFGENKARKTVKWKFLIIDCPSPYNCIIGWTTLVEQGVGLSMVHLKMRYHNDQDEVVTIHGDVEASMECYFAGLEANHQRIWRARGICTEPTTDNSPMMESQLRLRKGYKWLHIEITRDRWIIPRGKWPLSRGRC